MLKKKSHNKQIPYVVLLYEESDANLVQVHNNVRIKQNKKTFFKMITPLKMILANKKKWKVNIEREREKKSNNHKVKWYACRFEM